MLARFFRPQRYKWVITPNQYNRGHPVNDQIKDSTGLQAVRTCAGGMWTGLTSPSRPWFKLSKGLPWIQIDAAGEAWLKDTTDRISTVMAQSNWYTQLAQAFRDEITFGGSPLIIYEDMEDVIRLYVPCAGEYFLDVGGRLKVDRLYREFTYNTMQIIDFFKVENCPEQVVKAWEEGGAALQREWIVAHAIEPNFPIAKRRRGADERVFVVPEIFPWRELYWLRSVKTAEPLSKRGFHVKPFFVLMWSQNLE